VGDSPALLEGADLHVAAADVAALIDPDRPAVLVGHAFGNRVARCVAADHPSSVAGLGLLGCGGRVPGDQEAWAALRACFDTALTPEAHLAAVATAFFAPRNDPAVWTDGWWPDAAQRQSAATAATPVDDWWTPPAPVPVLAVVGADDRISPPANAADLVASVGDRGQLQVVPGAGHALVPEKPDDVVAALLAFLDQLDG
jgi:pimeloyl-ACP methyl ester carboxylesterase